ncbi:MAG: hypothetical protein OHK0021_16360 [Bryobacter sp.]
MDQPTRSQTHEIEIDALPEDVWKLLTEAEGIMRWFAPEARVEPGPGGKIFMSWGPGIEGEAPIHLWEPGKAFGWKEEHPGRPPRMIEFFLEGAGGKTKLRLVQSGFGIGAEFDDEYDAINGGWRTFLASLAYGVAHHGMSPCTQVAKMTMGPGPRETWEQRFAQRLSLAPAFADLTVGASFQADLPHLGPVQGQRLSPDKPGYYLLTLDSLHHSALALFFEKFGDQYAITTQCFLYGPARDQADQARQPLEVLYAE